MNLSKSQIVDVLNYDQIKAAEYFSSANDIVSKIHGSNIYIRGLIEFSNICSKDCLYCGIRCSNKGVDRYILPVSEIVSIAKYAQKMNCPSLVLQSGELETSNFTEKVAEILKAIQKECDNSMHITLSCGEQSLETYKYWRECGAHRYLLRFEASQEELFYRLHPKNKDHDHRRRLSCIEDLRRADYQVGSGMMIGLPYQTVENIADDILMLKDLGVHMVGLGPYNLHEETPLGQIAQNHILSDEVRVQLTLKTIAILRHMLPEINIAAATALQALFSDGRERALLAGANVLMPNLTPFEYKKNYFLYNKKPSLDLELDKMWANLNESLTKINKKIDWGNWGDSKCYLKGKSNE